MGIGDRALGSTIDFKFTTLVANVPTTLLGSPSAVVYRSGSSTPISAGVSLTTNFNSVVGLNDISIVASSGNGFIPGYDYQVILLAGTLGGVSVAGYTVEDFSINLAIANVTEIAGSAISANNLADATQNILRGTVGFGATTTLIPTSAFSPQGTVANQFANRAILFDTTTETAALQGQIASIISNSGSANPIFTISALTTVPVAGDTFLIT